MSNRKRFTFSGAPLPGILRGVFTGEETAFSEGGLWVCPPCDSGESGTVWDSARIECLRPERGYFRLIAAASDERYISHNDTKIPIENALAEYILGGSSPVESMNAAVFIDPQTVPLHRLKGRWLLFAVQFFPERGQSFTMKRIELTCPFQSYMQALPEVFSRMDNGNLTDLLALFSAVTLETDRELITFGGRLCPDSAAGKELERLLVWQGIGVTAIWEEERLRSLVKNSARLVRLKGTVQALSDLFGILLGEKPEISEDSTSASVTVTVEHKSVGSGRRYAELLRLLRDFTPAGVNARLVVKRVEVPDGTTLSDDSFGSGFIL